MDREQLGAAVLAFFAGVVSVSRCHFPSIVHIDRLSQDLNKTLKDASGTAAVSSLVGALQGVPVAGGHRPWPTQNFGWVHGTAWALMHLAPTIIGLYFR